MVHPDIAWSRGNRGNPRPEALAAPRHPRLDGDTRRARIPREERELGGILPLADDSCIGAELPARGERARKRQVSPRRYRRPTHSDLDHCIVSTEFAA